MVDYCTRCGDQLSDYRVRTPHGTYCEVCYEEVNEGHAVWCLDRSARTPAGECYYCGEPPPHHTR